MLAEAVRHQDLLTGHGLAQEVLESLKQLLAEYDRVTAECAQGRLAHVGASAELDVVAHKVVLLVRVLKGPNRIRFAKDSELLAAWRSATHVMAGRRNVGQ